MLQIEVLLSSTKVSTFDKTKLREKQVKIKIKTTWFESVKKYNYKNGTPIIQNRKKRGQLFWEQQIEVELETLIYYSTALRLNGHENNQ